MGCDENSGMPYNWQTSQYFHKLMSFVAENRNLDGFTPIVGVILTWFNPLPHTVANWQQNDHVTFRGVYLENRSKFCHFLWHF